MTDDVAVIVPAGLAIEEAARWVGNSCWAELRLQEVLTGWLVDEDDDRLVAAIWRVRADAAARSGWWHARLPELREMPRAAFVVPAGPETESALDALAEVSGTDMRRAALASHLSDLRATYEAHVDVAVGPADGPTAVTLTEAIESLAVGASVASGDG